MNPFCWLAKGVALVTLLLDLRASAQDTNATCTLASLQWSFNSQQQSPCVVASTLLGVCNGGDYNVVALPSTNVEYLGPTIDSANPCQCSTVVYSLMSACALCQNATITRWSQWTANCATVYNSYPQPIPGKLHVPAYAYLDVESQDIFDSNAAKQDANATESTALPTSSTTHSMTMTSTSQTSSASAPATSTATTSDSLTTPTNPRSNAIAGGVIGGILGLVCLLLLTGFFFAFRRRRRVRAIRRLRSEEDALGSPSTHDASAVSVTGPANMSEVQAGVSQTTQSSTQNIVPSISVSSSSDSMGYAH